MSLNDKTEAPSSSMNGTGKVEQRKHRSLLSSASIIATCTIAMLANTASSSSVSISLPTIQQDLQIPQAQLQWVVSGYPLSSGCLLLMFGRLADLYGRKTTFLLGSLWLLAFTLGCAFAKDPLTLNILRGIQGIGAAATIPASIGILAHSFPPGKSRSIAFATFAAGAPLGGGTGIVLGGLLTELTPQSWRSTFYLNTGITFLSMIGAVLSFDADQPSTEKDRRVDWLGSLFITTGLVLIVFVLGQGEVAPKQWDTPYIIALLIVGLAFVLIFLAWQYHLGRVQEATHENRDYPSPGSRSTSLSRLALDWLPSPPPVMKLTLWTRAHGRVAVIFCIAFLNWCCFLGWNYWVVLYYQNYIGFSPLRTVVRLVPMFVTGILCNAFVALFVGHVPMTILVACGTALTGCAALLFATIDPNAVYWAFGFPSAIIAVIGADFVFSCGTIFVAKESLPHEQSVAGAVFQTMTQLGTSLGVTVSTVVFDRALSQRAADAGLDITDATGKDTPQWISIKAYKAAQWTCFAFGICACLLAVLFLRGVGVIGHRGPSSSDMEEQKTITNSTRGSADERTETGSVHNEKRS